MGAFGTSSKRAQSFEAERSLEKSAVSMMCPRRQKKLPGWSSVGVLTVMLLSVNALYLYLSTAFVVPLNTSSSGVRFGPPDPADSSNVGGGGGDGGGSGVFVVDREVDFLEFAWQYPTDDDPLRRPVEMDHHDAYSGSWWQSASTFIENRFFASDELLGPSQEAASFQAFETRRTHVSATRDWLDLGVEHMSKWWQRALDEIEEELERSVVGRISNIFQRYVHSPDRRDFFHALPKVSSSSSSSWKMKRKEKEIVPTQYLVTKSTIAVIAFTPSCRNCVFDRGRDPNDLTNEVSMWSLAATLVSLIQTGIGRIVVSSHLRVNEHLVRQVFAIVANATSHWDDDDNGPWTTLEFCVTPDAAIRSEVVDEGGWGTNVPVAMLRQLHRVLVHKTTDDVTECWLGKGGRKRWRHVYFSEADLILVTKPDALPGLGRALRDGRLLAPHRLQPLPHASDFGGIDEILHGNVNVIPNRPPFEEVIEMDSLRRPDRRDDPLSSRENAVVFDSCCDRGTYKPNLVHEDCGNFWWQCGFGNLHGRRARKIRNSEPVTKGLPVVMVMHKRLLGYQFMRLKRGTGVVYASAEGGKTCSPHVGPCNKFD